MNERKYSSKDYGEPIVRAPLTCRASIGPAVEARQLWSASKILFIGSSGARGERLDTRTVPYIQDSAERQTEP